MTQYGDRLRAGDFDPPGGHELRPRTFRDEAEASASGLEGMTKADLLAYAQANGIDVSESMTKAEVRQAIEEAEG